MTFLAPLGLGFGIALPLLLLLYLLKVRRTERVVSSVLHWEAFQRDLAARDPWQKLRWSVLLALQLILLGALTLALARPSLVLPAPPSNFLAIVVDASPSMSATDVSPNRLIAAKVAARTIVDAAPDGATFALIEAGATARVLVPETTDSQTIDRGLDQVLPAEAAIAADSSSATFGQVRSVDDGLRIAGALARTHAVATIHLFSDGAYAHPTAWDDLTHFGEQDNGITLRFHPIGTNVGNRSITALALSGSTSDQTTTPTTAGGTPQLFAKVQNFDSRAATVTVTLSADGKTVESRALDLPAEGIKPLFFSSVPPGSQVIQLQLAPDDTLAADKIATLVRGDAHNLPILLVSRGNLFLQKALQSIPSLTVFQIAPRSFPGVDVSGYALIIFDGYAPDVPPTRNALLVNLPDTPWLPTQGTLRDPPITLWRSDEPTLAYVDLQSVRIARASNVRLPDWAHATVESAGTPLAFVGTYAGQKIVGLTFDIQQSNFPLSAAFPIFVANVVRYLTPDAVAPAAYLAPGQPKSVRPPPGVDRIAIDGPRGGHWEIKPTEATASFGATGQVGLYQATEYAGSTVASTERFAVDRFDPSVSDIRPRANLVDRVAPAPASTKADRSIREFAPWLLAFAFPLLILEWWWYHRR